jgi:hypothetical protein
MRFDYKTNENASSVYSDIFKEAISVAAKTQGNTTIKTPQGNALYQRPTLAISYVKVIEAFPPLPAKSPATQSTALETLDEETIQSAISTQSRNWKNNIKLKSQTSIRNCVANLML